MGDTTVTPVLTLRALTGETIRLAGPTLIIAGYTGRDEESVRAHIDELAVVGVPPPEAVPAFYTVDSRLLALQSQIYVDGKNTSGEAEPVIVRHRGSYFIGIGSDHTDRDIERTSVAAAKAACSKPLGSDLVRLAGDPSTWIWDKVTISSEVDGIAYQHALLTTLLHPQDLLRRLEAAQGNTDGDLVLFAGTVPLLCANVIAGRKWRLSLSLSQTITLSHCYAATTR